METNRTRVERTSNCCAHKSKTVSQEKSAKVVEGRNPEHAAVEDSTNKCCCGDTAKAKT